MKRSVAILVFEEVEVLDFAGPFEVFAVTSELHAHRLFDVALVAEREAPVRAVNGLLVVPNRTYAQLPRPDVLVVAGGTGTRRAMHDPRLLAWTAEAAQHAEVVLSVCSGARVLGALGLLDGKEVATHHQVFEDVAEIAPRAVLNRQARFVDAGELVTTGGISAGIDGSFHVVARLLGLEIALRTARYMEYAWTPDRPYPP